MRYLLATLALVALTAGFWLARPSLAPPPPGPLAAQSFRLHVRVLSDDPVRSSNVYNALSKAIGSYPVVVAKDPDWGAQHTGWAFGGIGSVDGEGSLPPGMDGAALRAEVLRIVAPLLDRHWDEVTVTCDTRDDGEAVRHGVRIEEGIPTWVEVDER